MTAVVAFYGQSRAGKDTAADFAEIWAVREGLTIERRSFARHMKLVAARALGYGGENPVDYVDHVKLNAQIVTQFAPHAIQPPPQDGRDFIIGLAEGIRDIDPEFWIRAAAGPSEADFLVYTDMRFHPEADYVRQVMGGLIFEVRRPNLRKYNEDTDIVPDRIIDNDGGLDRLRTQVEDAMDAAREAG
jgi:hypothetical protein